MDLNEGLDYFVWVFITFLSRLYFSCSPMPSLNPVLHVHSHHAEELGNGALRNPILALNKLSNYLVLEPLQFHLSLDGERGMVTKRPN